MKKVTLSKIFEFDAAHKLPNYKGPCANLHGHTYKMEVVIEGLVKENGMVIDFGELKKLVNESVISKLDHSYLNDRYPNPTAEIMVVDIFKTIGKLLAKNVRLVEVKLWETPTSCVIYRGG